MVYVMDKLKPDLDSSADALSLARSKREGVNEFWDVIVRSTAFGDMYKVVSMHTLINVVTYVRTKPPQHARALCTSLCYTYRECFIP